MLTLMPVSGRAVAFGITDQQSPRLGLQFLVEHLDLLLCANIGKQV
jgi:hypothetical protein